MDGVWRDSDNPGGDLRFSVLGSVRVWRGDQPLSTGSPQQRALLAALLLRAGRTATAGELIDALWGEEPPSQALAAVRTYASRLRKGLGAGVLVSESGGYAIRGLLEGALDLTTAQNLALDAETARNAGDLSRARSLLDQALNLWDGESLAGVPGPYAEDQRVRLEEWRLQLQESRLDMALVQGNHAEAVSELTALTAAHPLRERLRELLMLALYRSGRQAEALAVYADTRRLLADELGVDPRPGLRELQQRILQADPALSESTPRATEPAAVPVRPAQLPMPVYDFTGRAGFVAELSEILASAEGRVVAVAGIGGVGKTALAVRVAHQARAAFPDGQLYVDLRGAGPRGVEPESVLGFLLRALGTPDSAIPDSLEERAALYRSVLDGRRVLVLLDNARDAAQVRPLLPGTEGCAALVTSRVRMVDLAGCHLVDLDVMTSEEALQLFTKIVGEERVESERDAALEVLAACGFLPLAIRVAAARLAARRTWTVSVLATKLADEHRRLDELQAGDLTVKAAFELVYGQLEPAQARAFRLLSLADGPDISLAAAASVLELGTAETEDLLESLVDTSLLESAAPERYRYHDLVRLYARGCAERDEQPPNERDAAMSRLLDFYLATAVGAYAIERPGDRLVDHLEGTEYPGMVFPDRGSARDWLFTEAACLLSLVQQASAIGRLRKGADLLLVLQDLAESGSAFVHYQSAAADLRDLAVAVGDRHAEVRTRVVLAHVHFLAGRFAEADAEARKAGTLCEAVNDPWSTGRVLDTRAVIALHNGHHADGETHLRQAIENFRSHGDEPALAMALCNLSRIHLITGREESAVQLARQGVEISDRLGHTLRGAGARYALALALTATGAMSEAMNLLNEALEVFRASRQQLREGMTLSRVAEVHLAMGDAGAAAGAAEASLAVLGSMGGEWRRANVLTVLGRALDALGQTDRAAACLRDALAVYEALGSPEAEAVHGLLGPSLTA
ncbi:BTAD domain-containing putative transcriptional regulator [Streptomyces swartbergensis]|uniref:AfsR family transcriptional regulator n=1 Tax=Streptomyces swartbergensis TaxID=487165 RepID=A0A243S9P7_9ACTN|nr:AfsR family transcriptional regulator [Streptomyces swartbergensis]